jgi:hypothetical protein
MRFIFVTCAAIFFASFAVAGPPAENPCSPILVACEDKGYVDDKVADLGHKIWADCADLIIIKNEKVRGIEIEPGRLLLCRKYKQNHNTLLGTD